jgi:hypothetical protein
MWIDYSLSIAESVAELQARERAVRGQRAADRVKLLRLLKSGAARSVRQRRGATASARHSAGGGVTSPAAWPPWWMLAGRVAARSGSPPRRGPT